jgi:hypothetical protein
VTNWRDTSIDFVEIGKSLAVIENMTRNVRATAAVDDKRAKAEVQAAYSASIKMTRHLDNLRRSIDD